MWIYPYIARRFFIMADQQKRKGRKTISKRAFYEEELEPSEIERGETLDELFLTFIKAKELEGLREQTLKDHQTHYKYFKNYLEKAYPSIKYATEISTEVIRDYIYYMSKEKVLWDDHTGPSFKHVEERGLSPVTVNVRLRSLKCFLKFIFDEGHIESNPCKRVKLLKTEDGTIQSFSEEQINLLLKQPDQRTFTGFRDYVLMILFMDTGIRIKEALGVERKDFDYIQKTLTVPSYLAKNNKTRILPLSHHTAKLMNTLIKENSLFEGATNIFLSNYGEKLDSSGIRERIRDYGMKAKIDNVRVSPHTFRHTFAKFYILNGGDPFTLQRILDHSTMNMVRKHIQMNGKDIKLQHHQFIRS
jgi:integrase/recombinase XerD